MGVVYKAIDQKLRRAVAVKVLGPRYIADDRNKGLIFREARSAASLAHPNIAAIYELHEDGDAFYVMELVEGETLRQRIGRTRRILVAEALQWARQIASALAHAHAHGIVHRDLKADNVMITRAGDVKLLDFGIAKMLGLAEPIVAAVEEPVSVGLAQTIAGARGTEKGRVLGTPAYMAPEQARGEAVDKRADVFAFGVLLYEMLSGDLPFVRRGEIPSDSPSDWTKKAPIEAVAPNVPRAIAVLLDDCLELDRNRRIADGAALIARLDAVERTRQQRRRVALGVLAVVALTGTGVGGIAAYRATRAARQAQWKPILSELEPVYDEDSLRVEASPDGERLAFDSNRSGGFRVYVEPTAGGPAHLLIFTTRSGLFIDRIGAKTGDRSWIACGEAIRHPSHRDR